MNSYNNYGSENNGPYSGFDRVNPNGYDTNQYYDSGYSGYETNSYYGSGSGNSGGGQPPKGGKHKKEKKTVNLTRGGLTALIISCVLISSVFGFAGAMMAGSAYISTHNAGTENTNNANTTGFDLEDATGSEMTVQEITEKTLDSVVEIKTESVQTEAFLGQYVTEGAGSGVIIKSNGYIITNNHVINGANRITVTLTDKTEYPAQLVGTDPDNDVAVIKISAKNLPAVTMGNSDQLNVGDLAVAIGNPLGELGGTVTAGIISALDRSISIDGKTMSLLQTDTSINPGNSGGGLFNQYGQLIGVVVAKSSGSDVEGLGFAIPINTAATVADQLIEFGYAKGNPSTGMAYTEQAADNGMFGSFFGESGGTSVYIAEIHSSEAKKAGFQVGDLVVSVDGQNIDSFDTLSSIITGHEVGDTVTYVVERNGSTKEIKLVLGEKTN